MAPTTTTALSPAELSYLHTSLSLHPPLRSDSRAPTQFRPLVAEATLLPSANGSARICFSDGTEALGGLKGEVERSLSVSGNRGGMEEGEGRGGRRGRGRSEWVEVSVEIPGYREDDGIVVFLSKMLWEGVVGDTELLDGLWISEGWHWRIYIDILLLSPPLSYPLPLLSLTTHLSLLSTRLPALISEKQEDPLFNDDWEASTYLYPPSHPPSTEPTKRNQCKSLRRPAVTLLVMSVGANIFFDPTREELAVADAVLAITVISAESEDGLRVLAIRTIDPPSRLTTPGVPDTENSATGGGRAGVEKGSTGGEEGNGGVWRAPRGGMKRAVVREMIRMATEKGGVGEEVLAGLEGVDVR